jgi:uncharacterized RDD family membrane protein YckC
VNESHNPYSPPRAQVESGVEDERRELEPVGKGRRFATYLLDYVVLNVLLFVFFIFVSLVFGAAAFRAVAQDHNLLIAIAWFVAYYLFFEGVWARTPAKFMLGTVVVGEDGGKPPFGKIVIRTLCRFIPFEPFSFFGQRGWHDGMSDTRVVSTRG